MCEIVRAHQSRAQCLLKVLSHGLGLAAPSRAGPGHGLSLCLDAITARDKQLNEDDNKRRRRRHGASIRPPLQAEKIIKEGSTEGIQRAKECIEGGLHTHTELRRLLKRGLSRLVKRGLSRGNYTCTDTA